MLNPFRTFPRRSDAKPNAGSTPASGTAPHLRTGSEGEDAAARAVRARGWKILDRNWRAGHLELDIVCEDGEELIFLEVKTRAENSLSSPLEALTREKRRRLIRAAQAWLSAHDAWERPCRFDLACVTAGNTGAGTYYRTEILSHVIEQ